MKSRFFADPDDNVRVTFSDGPLEGEWVKLRSRLSDAEEKGLVYGSIYGFQESPKGQVMVADLIDADKKVLRAWVTRWSLGGDRERGTRPSNEQLDTILGEYVDQIMRAIAEHKAEVDADREALVSPKAEASSSQERVAGTSSTTGEAESSGPPSYGPAD